MTEMEQHLRTVLAWAEGVLESTNPDDPESYFNDHARECAEAIAFDKQRKDVAHAIAQLKGTSL